MTDDKCKTDREFRFYRNDIYNLIDVLCVPAEFTCYNGLKVDVVEEMCIFLKRFAYPFRYAELIPRFSKPEPHVHDCKSNNEYYIRYLASLVHNV
jgi:hypothetical protein